MKKRYALLTALVLVGSFALVAARVAGTQEADATDPARNTPLPCEAVSTPGLVARAAKNIDHVANVCGIVGTDIEFQSRTDLAGGVHDYAFVGTMGAGFRVFDITDPAHPLHTGGYADPGWENDVQVRGDIVVATFDGVNGEDSSGSTGPGSPRGLASQPAASSCSTARSKSASGCAPSRSRRSPRTKAGIAWIPCSLACWVDACTRAA
jgi:hypothetical protein